jgi:hypothetical protein
VFFCINFCDLIRKLVLCKKPPLCLFNISKKLKGFVGIYAITNRSIKHDRCVYILLLKVLLPFAKHKNQVRNFHKQCIVICSYITFLLPVEISLKTQKTFREMTPNECSNLMFQFYLAVHCIVANGLSRRCDFYQMTLPMHILNNCRKNTMVNTLKWKAILLSSCLQAS